MANCCRTKPARASLIPERASLDPERALLRLKAVNLALRVAETAGLPSGQTVLDVAREIADFAEGAD